MLTVLIILQTIPIADWIKRAHTCVKEEQKLMDSYNKVSIFMGTLSCSSVIYTQCVLNKLSHPIYWTSPFAIYGMSG